MKVAALISGYPRFTEEFDIQLKNLQNYDQVDWFFLLWNDRNDLYLSPTWPSDIASIRTKIESNLPEHHKIASLAVVEQPAWEYEGHPFNLTPWSNPPRIWYMYYGMKVVNQLRLDYEKVNGEYDLVVRTRPDISIDTPVDFRQAYQALTANPNVVLTPATGRTGMIGNPITDVFAIGLGPTMTTYCNCFDQLFEYNSRGLPFHAETLLIYHLAENHVATPMTDIHHRIRPSPEQQFGRWA